MIAIERVPLSTVCRQDRGAVRAGEFNELRYLGMESIEPGGGRLAQGQLAKVPEAPQANTFRFTPGHVLYGKLRPYLNKVFAPDFEGKCSTELIPLLPTERLDRRYLAYFLRAPNTVEAISQKVAGARMPRADMNFVMSLPIPLPPVKLQQKVVETLARAENIVMMRREAEQKAKEIIPALFLDMFGDPATNPKGWDANRLGDVVEDVRNGFNPPKKAFGIGLPFVTVNSLYDGLTINMARLQRVNPTATDIRKYILKRGDICFARSSVKRSGVGMASIFDSDAPAIFGGFVIRVRLKERMLPSFICAMMHTESLRTIIVDNSGTGTITNLNQPALLRLPIICPPLEKQKAYEHLVLELQNLTRDQSSAVALAISAFKSLLAGVFGERA